MISRRRFLGGLGLAAIGPASATPLPESLGDVADRAGLLYGASIGDEAASHPAYRALYARETRIVTTDVALKFDWLRPTPKGFDFARADAIVGDARAAGKLVRGHTLIWNDNAPDWLKRLSGREVERVFDAHIETVVGRYAGKLHSWDVVNEPFWPMDDQPGGWRNGPWYAAMGPSYVERAFRRVASIDGEARLTLNEAQCENDHEWGRSIRPPLARLVDDLLQRGAPLQAIGFQSHLQPQWPSDFPAFAEYAAAFGRKGLDIYLTEFDVDDESFPDDVAARTAATASFGAAFLNAVLKVPQVKVVVNWQLSDRFSWYREEWRRQHPSSRRSPRPLPFDENLQPNPLREAMVAAFRAR